MILTDNDTFDIAAYYESGRFPRIIETDHSVFINGMFIPFVCRGMTCEDNDDRIKTVSLKIVTDSYIRLSGAASEAFEKKHDLQRFRGDYVIWGSETYGEEKPTKKAGSVGAEPVCESSVIRLDNRRINDRMIKDFCEATHGIHAEGQE